MGLPARRAQQLEVLKLPACFDELPNGYTKELAKEIYDALLSLQKLRPEVARSEGPSCCPAMRLGRRKARYIVDRVLQGARFKTLDLLETDKVEFVGPMSGVIEAVNRGAVDDILKELFFDRVRKLVSALASSNMASLRSTSMSRQFWERVGGQKRLGTGIPTLEKLHGCWIQIVRNNGIATIAAFRVIDVDFHPDRY